MKKVLIPKQSEEATYYCDKHNDRQCYGHLRMNFWYGSKFDMSGNEVHLCDECAEEVMKYLKTVFGEAAKLADYIEI
jgi:NAD-dependent SIR2 family protein deacetylase